MLVTSQQDMNLGTLKFGKPYNFTYTLTNTSTSIATIMKVSAGCQSCTTASAENKEVKPGGDVTIKATFTPGSTGINVKTISVAYNINGVQLNVPLKFKANVIA